METELVIKLLTEFRDDMNRGFERLETRMDKRFDEVELNAKALELRLMREIAKLHDRTEELLWMRRELRSRKKRSGS
jgi:hypothetical protein